MPPESFADFNILFFDVYGTLVDWESGIYNALRPLLSRYPASSKWTRKQALEEFNAIEVVLKRDEPHLLYRDLLAKTHELLERKLRQDSTEAGTENMDSSRHIAFGQSVGNWPVFPDTIAALHILAKRYKLCVLSNVDRESFAQTLAQLSVDTVHPELYQPPSPSDGSKYWFPRDVSPESKSPFTLILTAEDVGAYKPARRALDTALNMAKTDSHFDDGNRKVLWVAHSLSADIDPMGKLGIPSVWIERNGSEMGLNGKHAYTWKFDTLGEFAAAVEREV
ncbi:hypothetical protein VNI00_016600 [Paramarasmius palmivorus]|uniref:Haloacid dehalogenase n=1 Tax=Paramarasmius palmivorus TaxID=297713 RepID=A0AAW0BCR3_9AGAR